MINIFIFISLILITTFLLGTLLEKIRIPWLFGALLFGSILAFNNPFNQLTNSSSFVFLSQLGMYFLLFLIGLEINLPKLLKSSRLIIKTIVIVIFLESLIGGLFIHYVLNYSWLISFLVSISFATVGEAVLIPILDELKLINTRLGQLIIGIGTVDDLIEISILILVSFLISVNKTDNNLAILASLLLLFFLTFSFLRLKTLSKELQNIKTEILILLSLAVFFFFLGIGKYGHSSAIAAIFAGISLKGLIPQNKHRILIDRMKTLTYSFFAPFFFFWVGASMEINYLISFPLIVIAITLLSNFSKILGSFISAHQDLGLKKSILLGIGLSVRFSTSIIIIKILFDNHLINSDLYSIIVASSIIFKFVVPLLFAKLAVKWLPKVSLSKNIYYQQTNEKK